MYVLILLVSRTGFRVAPMILTSWYLYFCIITSPWVWETCDLLLISRIRQKVIARHMISQKTVLLGDCPTHCWLWTGSKEINSADDQGSLEEANSFPVKLLQWTQHLNYSLVRGPDEEEPREAAQTADPQKLWDDKWMCCFKSQTVWSL